MRYSPSCEISKDLLIPGYAKKYFVDIMNFFYIFVPLLIPGVFLLTSFSHKRIQPNIIFN